jgi:hypothetical protein
MLNEKSEIKYGFMFKKIILLHGSNHVGLKNEYIERNTISRTYLTNKR